MNDRKIGLLNAGEPDFLQSGPYIGKITEGTLGRMSSTVANYALRSGGGGFCLTATDLPRLLIANTAPQLSVIKNYELKIKKRACKFSQTLNS